MLTLTRNTLNDPYFPTSGSEIWVSTAVAGLGGNNFFYSLSAGASWFHPIVGDLVLNLRATAGTIHPFTEMPVPVNEKFYVGGIKTMRGFEYGFAGPVGTRNVYTAQNTGGTDSRPDEYVLSGKTNSDPIGSLNMVVGNVELLYPLSKALGLRAAVFYDVGKGWGGGAPGNDFDNSFLPLRQSVGVGIRWYSPFGPIRIDWGYNLSPRSGRGEKSNVWDFSMGTLF
jgi:outer membrane protein insertion porin family